MGKFGLKFGPEFKGCRQLADRSSRAWTARAPPVPGDVICSGSPPPYGHVGIMTDQGTVIHSTPGQGVHESALGELTAYSPIDGVIPR